MANISRLHLRKNTYYVRIVVPNSIKDLVKKNEIKYSLKTNNYFDALSKLRIESAKIEMFFCFVRELAMDIKNNAIILTDDELDKVLVYRLRQIDDFYENHYNKIQNGNIDFEDIGLFTQKKVNEYNEKHRDPNVLDTDDDAKDVTDYNFIKSTIQDLFFDYLKWLKNRPNTTLSLYNFIEKISKNRAAFFQLTQNDENSQRSSQMLDFYHHLLNIDDWAQQKLGIKPRTRVIGTDHPKITKLERTLLHQKQQELMAEPTILTKWQDVYEDMVRPLRHNNSVDESYLKTKKQCLETIFELIDKQYVEQISFDDCRKINKLIYFIPKKWRERYPNKRLIDVLLTKEEDRSKAISSATILKYICHFQDLLKYCRRQGLINVDMSDIFTKPKLNKNKNVWQPFEIDELKKIFAPKTYFKRKNDNVNDNYKYWVPIISLFSGMRLNEICQLKVQDIKRDEKTNIDYFFITDDDDNQSVKNYASKRRVPIHPFLKKLGFMKQVEATKKQKKERLFYSIQYTKKSKYGGSMSNAFRHYLDKVIEIKDKKKVFHSFRHLARVTYLNNNVSEEMVNLLCGWEGKGCGAKNYLHREKVDIKKLDDAIKKLKYKEVEKILLGK